ncbi:NUDIX hydrolase [Aestuariispira insulae]|uniref:NrtR DNA-binding winged helix domain-containing protein n=1 Tax=Aestuariispira insulae TaxID=1461337 RepID=A0A3D9HVY5_9PROT|nr:NAD regulator [Aestuariispira insulae]RED53673.1 hypothetical protein DFP90_101465 [Aestuariispira insulae]
MASQVIVGLNVVVVTLEENEPRVMIVRQFADIASEPDYGLPFGPLDVEKHRTLEEGLRTWVHDLTQHPLGYVEQLYTFGDRDRYKTSFTEGGRVLSVGYLALSRPLGNCSEKIRFPTWYDYLPWEDWREGEPAILEERIYPALRAWVASAETRALRDKREARILSVYGLDGGVWDNDRVLDRYEILYEANLVAEAYRDAGMARDIPDHVRRMGASMVHDHRRILATAIGRLRGKIKFRPVVFELLEEEFTLYQLQLCVEALSGKGLHKQNFRRLIEAQGLVEETGGMFQEGRGRPAKLFRFRADVQRERVRPGVKLSL